MLISIIGNICTGKTTLAEYLAQQLNAPHLAVDDYRLRVPERYVYKQLAKDVKRFKDSTVIIESSGISGRIYDAYRAHNGPRFTILLKCDPQTLLDRYNNRTEHVPYPWAKGKDIESEIQRMQNILNDKRADYTIDTGEVPEQVVLETVYNVVMNLLYKNN